MKINAPMVKAFSYISNKRTKKNIPTVEVKSYVDAHFDIPYIDDGLEEHKYDLFITKRDRKNVCIIDIHGGSYLFGSRKYNDLFGKDFLKNGFDFISVDYLPNKKGRSTKDIIDDCIRCINHVCNNLEKYNLKYDKIVIAGDSAGGHLALIISEMLEDNSIAKKLGFSIVDITPICTLVNCPAYDYVNLGQGRMTKGARRVMFGNDVDEENLALYSPRTYIEDFHLPLFLSTCKNDFIRGESLILNEDMQKKDNKYKFIDLDCDKKEVGHVHNVSYPDLEESKFINKEMMRFVEEVING